MERLGRETGSPVAGTGLPPWESELSQAVRNARVDGQNKAGLWRKAAWGFWTTNKQQKGNVRSWEGWRWKGI